MTLRRWLTMHPNEPPPIRPDDDAERLLQEGLLQEGLDPIPMPACRREALLRRILERTGGPAMPAIPADPRSPPKAD